MVNVLQAVAGVVLVSGLPFSGRAATDLGRTQPFSAEAGWRATGPLDGLEQGDERFGALALPHGQRVDASVFRQQQKGYFSEAYALAPERTLKGMSAALSTPEPTDVALAQVTRHETLAATSDTDVLAAFSSKLASTPEPASLALLGTGALSAVAMLRRRVH